MTLDHDHLSILRCGVMIDVDVSVHPGSSIDVKGLAGLSMRERVNALSARSCLALKKAKVNSKSHTSCK